MIFFGCLLIDPVLTDLPFCDWLIPDHLRRKVVLSVQGVFAKSYWKERLYWASQVQK